MPRGRDAQPDIVLTDPLRRRRHEARARMALLTRLIADELRALAQPDATARGRRRQWIAQAQTQRRAWLAEVQACQARIAAHAPGRLETKSAPLPPRRTPRHRLPPPAHLEGAAPPGLC